MKRICGACATPHSGAGDLCQDCLRQQPLLSRKTDVRPIKGEGWQIDTWSSRVGEDLWIEVFSGADGNVQVLLTVAQAQALIRSLRAALGEAGEPHN